MRETLPTTKNKYNKRVEPVKRRRTRGTLYEDEFTFGEVVMDFDPDEVFPDDAEKLKGNGVVYYMYPGKAPVMIDENGVKVYRSASVDEGERQAYFVLSMLDAEGYVTNWRKK